MYDFLCGSVRHQNYDHVNTMVSLVRNEQIIMTAQSLHAVHRQQHQILQAMELQVMPACSASSQVLDSGADSSRTVESQLQGANSSLVRRHVTSRAFL